MKAATRLRSLGFVAIVLITTLAGVVITLAASAALSANEQVIRVLRLIGARDSYIAHAFVRRYTLRALGGSAVGTVLGALALFLLPSAGSEGGFLTGLGLQGWQWLWPLLIPPFAALVAFLATPPSRPDNLAGETLMRHAIQWLRSLLFITQMYIMLPIVGFIGVPLVWIKRDNAFKVIRFYCNWVRWTASWMVGLKSEIRGEVPTGEVLIAAKHQSFFDILLLASVLPRLKFIYKSQLKWAPIINIYAVYTNSIPVNRGKKGAAIKQMVAAVKDGQSKPGQLVIFSQGTRVAAGAKKPYKVGTGVLYKETGQPVIPRVDQCGRVLETPWDHAPSGACGAGIPRPRSSRALSWARLWSGSRMWWKAARTP